MIKFDAIKPFVCQGQVNSLREYEVYVSSKHVCAIHETFPDNPRYCTLLLCHGKIIVNNSLLEVRKMLNADKAWLGDVVDGKTIQSGGSWESEK